MIFMSYKLVALDMDDTLLSEDLSISEKNLEAIRAMENSGVKIILCSGRPYDAMIKYIDVLDIHSKDDYIVSFNGAFINKISGEEVYSGIIEGEVLNTFIDIGRKRKISVQLYTPNLTIEQYTERTAHYEQLTGMKAQIVENLKIYDKSVKVLYNHFAGDELEALRLEIMDKFGEYYNIFYSKPFYIEVLNRKSSKGLAVAYLANRMGLEASDVLCMGDGFNDVSMIEYAGMGAAVANAPEGVKAVADYVTLADHNHDAVWEVYQRFFQ